MRWVSLLFLLLLFPVLVWAEPVICGDATKLQYFQPSVDPTRAAPCPAPYAQFVLTETNPGLEVIEAQKTLYATIPQQHLKVVGGLMVEMTPQEQAAVDAPGQLKAAQYQAANTEVQSNTICSNHTLQQITDYWKGPGGKQSQLQATIATLDTAIAALTAGPAKTAIQAARDALVAHMTMFIDDSELQWRYICSRAVVSP
jgi:hypothetical protein